MEAIFESRDLLLCTLWLVALRSKSCATVDRVQVAAAVWREISKVPQLVQLFPASLPTMSSSASQSAMDAVVVYVTYTLSQLQRIPGSAILGRYIKSSYQDDPGRTLLEVILVLFAVGTLLQNRTRARGRGGFVKLTEKVRPSLRSCRRRALTNESAGRRRSTSSLRIGNQSLW